MHHNGIIMHAAISAKHLEKTSRAPPHSTNTPVSLAKLTRLGHYQLLLTTVNVSFH